MMMKWLIRLSFPALGLLLLLIFFGLNDPEHVSAPVSNEEPADIPDFERLVPTPVPTEGPDIIFKWRDTDGNWHYADHPPEHGPWNTLAIERPDTAAPATPNSDTDWESPYSAPFTLGPGTGNNGS